MLPSNCLDWRLSGFPCSPEEGVGEIILRHLHDVLKIQLGVGIVNLIVSREEWESKVSDRLHTGIHTLASGANIIKG